MNDRILVYGNYMHSKPGYGGQITKTRNVFACLKQKYGEDNVFEFNMENWKKHPISTFIRLKKELKRTKHLVILPGDNNLKLLLLLLRKYIIKNNLKVYYMVVGGWLYDYLKGKRKKIDTASLFKGIFVETHELQNNLFKLGLENVYYSPVFSLRKTRSKKEIDKDIEFLKNEKHIKLCTFSRVLKEKGVADAIEAISLLNKESNKYQLDVYGAIDETFREEFETLLKNHKEYVKYCGFIDDDKVIDTLAKYHFMIFPTYYYGEGFPATLLEANMAGLPILASDWKYNKEIVIDKVSGYLFAPKDITGISDIILLASSNQDSLFNMRFAALENADKYTPNKALKPLFEVLEKERNEK